MHSTSPQPVQQSPRIHSPAPQAIPAEPVQDVGASIVMKSDEEDSAIEDAQREVQILHEGRAIEAAMARYAQSSDLQDRADADAARIRMEGLIRSRSAQTVRRMERDRGIE